MDSRSAVDIGEINTNYLRRNINISLETAGIGCH